MSLEWERKTGSDRLDCSVLERVHYKQQCVLEKARVGLERSGWTTHQRRQSHPAVILTVSDSATQNDIKYLTFGVCRRAGGPLLQDIIPVSQ